MLKKLKWDTASINYDDFTLKGGIIKEVNFNAIRVKKKVFKTIFGESTDTIREWGLIVYIQTDDGYDYKAVYSMGTTSSLDDFNNVPTIIKNNTGKKNNKLNPLLVIPLLLDICNVDNFNELVGSKIEVMEKAPYLNEKGFAIHSIKTCNSLLPKYFEIQKSGTDDSTISENNKGKKKKKVKFLNEDNKWKIGYTGEDNEELIIPKTITEDDVDYEVVGINEGAFMSCKNLSSVTIPESVTTIGEGAFSDCTSLSSVTIPNSVTEIIEGAFDDCDNLTTINIDNVVDAIPGAPWGATNATINWLREPVDFIITPENRHMVGYTDTTEELVIPSTFTGDDGVNYKVVSIGDSAFWGCENLSSITIPDGVTTIDNYAFENCHSLTSFTIPDGVTSISDWAFANCNLLTSIDIPESVTIIGYCAFWYCKSLTSITIPNNITAISDGAFNTCIKLTSITIPEGVTSIESGTFNQCESLTNIDIPNTVTSIGNVAFWGCTSLTSIDIPNSVTSIGTNAFLDCANLTTINIDNVTDSISSAPWNANNAIIRWLQVKNDDLLQKGCDNIEEFFNNIIKEKDGCIFKDYQDEFKNTITSLIKSAFGYPGNPNNKPYGLDMINSVLKSDLKSDNVKYTISIVYKTKTTPRHWKIHKTEESE